MSGEAVGWIVGILFFVVIPFIDWYTEERKRNGQQVSPEA